MKYGYRCLPHKHDDLTLISETYMKVERENSFYEVVL
ncbi:hypothetical protein LEMLEM_LOCUS13635 [Lemmus lemmus]